jgi:hypothetical protein
MIDDLILCDRCGSDAAYKQEINETVTLIQCFGCGFQTSTLMKRGEKFFDEQIELLPNLYKELMGEDEEGKIWFPGIFTIEDKGMVFANGKNANNWKWAAVKAVLVKEEEKTKYPIPGKKGEYYKWRMDYNTLEEFEENNFMDALSSIGIIP